MLIMPARGGGDKFYSSVSMLLHGDGTNGATSTVDSSSSHKTMTMNNSTLDTGKAKFGVSSMKLNAGVTSRITTPGDVSLSLTGNFTIEAFVWLTAAPTGGQYFMFCGAGASTDGLYCGFKNGDFLVYRDTGAEQLWPWTPVTGAWFHICFMKTGTSIYAFINGVSLSNNNSPNTFLSSSLTVVVGGLTDNGFQLNGWLDEFRITKGVLRYATGGFTPPVAPFANFS